jgi:hypothetical protein
LTCAAVKALITSRHRTTAILAKVCVISIKRSSAENALSMRLAINTMRIDKGAVKILNHAEDGEVNNIITYTNQKN